MRFSLVPVATTIVVGLLVAACGSSPTPAPVTTPRSESPPPVTTPRTSSPPGTIPPPTPAANPTGTLMAGIEHATGPTDVVLQFDSGPDGDGGWFQPGPEFTLYGDGTVIFRNEREQQLTGDLPIIRGRPFMTARLNEEQIQSVLRFAIGEGGLGSARPRYDTRSGYDDIGYSIFIVRAGALGKRVEVVGGTNSPFSALAEYLRTFDDGSLSSSVWVPDRYWGLLGGQNSDPQVPDLSDVPWPWPGIAPEDFGSEDSLDRRRVMSSEEAAVLGLSDDGGVVERIDFIYRGPDRTQLYSFSLWPILPEVPPPIPDPSPAPTTATAPTPSLAPGPLRIDGLARVAVDRLRVRSAPGTGADSEWLEPLLDTGTMLFLIAGPVADSGYDWYRIAPTSFGNGGDQNEFRYHGDPGPIGWVASADRDGTPWIVGTRVECPDPAGSDTDLAAIERLGPLVALSCYRETSIQIRARLGSRGFVDDFGPGMEPDPMYPDTYWASPVSVEDSASFGSVLDRQRFPKGVNDHDSVWNVIGHFDDELATTCGTYRKLDDQAVAADILTCRTTFVVTDLVAVERYTIDLRSSEPEGMIAAGTTVMFSATVSPIGPADDGPTVRFEIYREDGGEWRIATSRDVAADATGRASLSWTFVTTGSHYVRAMAPANATHAASAWIPLRYTVP